jgi:hypothetical protein
MFTKNHIAAGNDTMHRELLKLLKEAGKEASKGAVASKEASAP